MEAVEPAHCDHCGWEGLTTDLITSGSDLNEYCPECGSTNTWWGAADEIFVVPDGFEKHLPPMKSLPSFDNATRLLELEAEVTKLREALQDVRRFYLRDDFVRDFEDKAGYKILIDKIDAALK